MLCYRISVSKFDFTRITTKVYTYTETVIKDCQDLPHLLSCDVQELFQEVENNWKKEWEGNKEKGGDPDEKPDKLNTDKGEEPYP